MLLQKVEESIVSTIFEFLPDVYTFYVES